MNRNESDAAAAIAIFVLGMLALLCATVVILNVLSGMPSVMAYGVLFSVAVFIVVCGIAFLKSDLRARHSGPPQLEFRNPARRPRRTKRRSRPAE